jgi:hypothetical protein
MCISNNSAGSDTMGLSRVRVYLLKVFLKLKTKELEECIEAAVSCIREFHILSILRVPVLVNTQPLIENEARLEYRRHIHAFQQDTMITFSSN